MLTKLTWPSLLLNINVKIDQNSYIQNVHVFDAVNKIRHNFDPYIYMDNFDLYVNVYNI